MYVVMVASECAPVAQAGGLGEVVFGLSRELELRGHQVEILLPKYDCMRYDRIEDLHIIWFDLWVPWGGGGIHTTVWAGWVYGRRCLFLEPHSSEGFFNRGHYYGSPDDVSRFAFFCKAALEFLLRSGRRPDVLHCHDWQTGLVPVLLYEMYQHAGMATQRVCYTIHNFSHQGLAGEYILAATGLSRPQHYFDYERLRDNFNPFAINLMKGGIVYSNFVTTVSPQHAWEVMSTEQGMGLGETLHRHSVKFTGVLNGVDYEVWNTQTDPHVPVPYDVHDVSGKYAAKRALRDRCLMAHPFKPVVAYVGRLDRQKGVHLIEHAIFYALAQGAQFILLGSAPDPAVAGHFRNLKNRLNDNPDCHLELEFNQELAHQIYAGADLIVVPSLFEPCGLTQLIALRYGTVPVVRAIGGLVDTVFDRDYSDRPPEERNGYVFHQVDGPALESAMIRAIGLWYVFPEMFYQLMANGMRSDHSWAGPGQAYLDIYEHIRHR